MVIADTGCVKEICISEKKGERKIPISRAEFIKDHGIAGDAHAGGWHRQISLLSAEDIAGVRSRLPNLRSGDFAENVIVSSLPTELLGLGSVIGIGHSVRLRISQLGKECHSPCIIAKSTGDCIMPRLGLFAEVLQGGTVSSGDQAAVLECVPREKVQAVLIIPAGTDKKGAMTHFNQGIKDLDVNLYEVAGCDNNQESLSKVLFRYLKGRNIDVIIAAGFAPGSFPPNRNISDFVTVRSVHGDGPSGLAETWRSLPPFNGRGGSAHILLIPSAASPAISNLESV
jgi:MOSC domain-containing protein YiiM